MANVLHIDRQVAVIAALCEGVSLRAAARLADVHRDSAGALAVRVGEGCAVLHDRMMRDLRSTLIQLDEIWSFVQKKAKRVKADDPLDYGDQYTFVAMDAVHKTILTYLVDKRDDLTTRRFVTDLRARVLGRPQISSDGWQSYVGAIEDAFGADADYGMQIKDYKSDSGERMDAARRYSPGRVEAVDIIPVAGNPDPNLISTSFVERQNLTIRMHARRFTRLTNAFSKKLRNHRAAFDLYVFFYNFVRVHETLRVTPAMSIGVTEHVWSVREMIGAALAASTGDMPPPRPTATAPRLIKPVDPEKVLGDQYPKPDPRFPDDVSICGGRNSVQRQLGNAVPSLLAEVLGREIRTQLLGGRRIKSPPRLLPPNNTASPPREPVMPVDPAYLHLVGEHDAHPGTGKGYAATVRSDSQARDEARP